MTRSHRQALAVGLVLTLLVLLLALSAATRETYSEARDNQCIQCHISAFNAGLNQPYRHSPFLEHRCTTCHLEAGWQQQTLLPTAQTGELVTQEPLWARRIRHPASSQATRRHLVVLPGLQQDARFRFRIVQAGSPSGSQDNPVLSRWLGLVAAELPETGSGSAPVRVNDLAQKTSGQISDLELYREDPQTIVVSWQTTAPLLCDLELEHLADASTDSSAMPLQATGGDPASSDHHAGQRNPEELAIEACHDCHLPASLGTSHPVRLYSTSQVIIPADLPTVNDGMMTCVTCHDPHGSTGKSLVRETVKTKLCVACHIRFKGTSTSTLFE